MQIWREAQLFPLNHAFFRSSIANWYFYNFKSKVVTRSTCFIPAKQSGVITVENECVSDNNSRSPCFFIFWMKSCESCLWSDSATGKPGSFSVAWFTDVENYCDPLQLVFLVKCSSHRRECMMMMMCLNARKCFLRWRPWIRKRRYR